MKGRVPPVRPLPVQPDPVLTGLWYKGFFLTAALFLIFFVLLSCTSTSKPHEEPAKKNSPAPVAVIIDRKVVTEDPLPVPSESPEAVIEEEEVIFEYNVPSPQVTVYNGTSQPIYYYCSGGDEPSIVYYLTPESRDAGRVGSTAAPVSAGFYYVRVKFPRYASEFYAEYRIQKSPVAIRTEGKQSARYNGDPQRIIARAEPAVPLNYSYYPNLGLRDSAVNSARLPGSEESSRAGYSRSFSQTFDGYRRVDRAPIEQGTYYVWVFFPGDVNYEAAEAFVEFEILPPLPRR